MPRRVSFARFSSFFPTPSIALSAVCARRVTGPDLTARSRSAQLTAASGCTNPGHRRLVLVFILIVLLFTPGCRFTEVHTWPWLIRVVIALVGIPFGLLMALMLIGAFQDKEFSMGLTLLTLGWAVFLLGGGGLAAISFFRSVTFAVDSALTARTSLLTAETTIVLSLIVNLLKGALSNPTVNTSGHEWHYMTRDGKLGGFHSNASARDVYEHRHGRGSWEARASGVAAFVTCLRVATAFSAIVGSVYYLSHRTDTPPGTVYWALTLICGVVAAVCSGVASVVQGSVRWFILASITGAAMWLINGQDVADYVLFLRSRIG